MPGDQTWIRQAMLQAKAYDKIVEHISIVPIYAIYLK